MNETSIGFSHRAYIIITTKRNKEEKNVDVDENYGSMRAEIETNERHKHDDEHAKYPGLMKNYLR